MSYPPSQDNFPTANYPYSFENFTYEPFTKQNMNVSKAQKTPSTNYIDYMTSTIITHTSTPSQHCQSLNDLKYIFEHLRLENFKTQSCKVKSPHNFKMCPFYHNTGDKRRMGNFYSSEFCEDMAKSGQCSNGELCKKSHNLVEQLYSPDQYKTKFCSFFPKNIELCDYGRYCCFAHSENEIVVELLHNYIFDDDFFIFLYKTVWCPFSFFQHDKNLCVYAHNFLDFRRKPINNKYINAPCAEWNENNKIMSYNDGCSKGTLCEKCHGWYEYEFHPMNYKTKECEKKNECNSKANCPFYHDNSDKRDVPQEMLWNMFKYVPKNRVSSKTFKITRNENIFFDINTKPNKSGLAPRSNVPKYKQQQQPQISRQNKSNRPISMQNIDPSSAPFYYEPSSVDPKLKTKSSLQTIQMNAEFEEMNPWSKNEFRKMTSLEKITMSLQNEEIKKENSALPAMMSKKELGNLNLEKENSEEYLEDQFKNILKNICEDENDESVSMKSNYKQ